MKEVILPELKRNNYRFFKILLILVFIFAIWLMIVLFSFDPSDPSWSQTAWNASVQNLGGIPGAWLADMFFFIFGIMAYGIPVIIGGFCFIFYRQVKVGYIDYFTVSLRLIGALTLILTSCSLAAINADDIWHFASGGVIGNLLNTAFQLTTYSYIETISMLFIWTISLTLFTGWSWINIAEKIGNIVLNVLIKNVDKKNKYNDDQY